MFFRNIHKRMKIILLIIFFILLIIALRVFYIQVIDYKKLNKYANSLWNRNLPIEGNRGIIYDNSGNVIVDNITTTSLIIIPNQVKDKSKTATLLANILGVSYNEMYNHVNKKSSIERVHPEGRRLDFKVADRISELNLPGIYLVKERVIFLWTHSRIKKSRIARRKSRGHLFQMVCGLNAIPAR